MIATETLNAYARQIASVETKLLYESFLLMSLELQDEQRADWLENLSEEALRCRVSRQLALDVLDSVIEVCPSREVGQMVYVRAFGILQYLFGLKDKEFLEYNNSLPEYMFDLFCDAAMVWRGQGDFGFFVFEPVALQARIDAIVGKANSNPLD